MNEEFFDRTYQTGRAALNADLVRAAHAVGRLFGRSLAALHRIEWDAPWQAPPRTSRLH